MPTHAITRNLMQRPNAHISLGRAQAFLSHIHMGWLVVARAACKHDSPWPPAAGGTALGGSAADAEAITIHPSCVDGVSSRNKNVFSFERPDSALL